MINMLENIIDIVKRTKSIILDINKKNDVTVKGYGNYVTQVDFEVQSYLKEQLFALFPSIQFMGEEETSFVDFENASVWILDPIDGTANLIHNLNQSAVTLGLVTNYEPVLGVVYNPFTDELFYAEKGKGAYFNGEKISVEEAEKIAKQEIVNLCCDNSYVSSVKITYGIFNYSDYYKGGYEFEAQGTYLPIDSYGMYGDMQKFNIRLTVENDGKATVIVESFSPAY